MGAAKDFFDDLKSFITVETEVSHPGEALAVEERFTLRIKISNTAGPDMPFIRFYIYDCKVSRTANAVPIDTDGNELDYVLPFSLQHQSLDTSSQQFIDAGVFMKALRANPESSSHGGMAVEKLAKIEIAARWEAGQCYPLVVEKAIRHDIVPS